MENMLCYSMPYSQKCVGVGVGVCVCGGVCVCVCYGIQSLKLDLQLGIKGGLYR